MEWRRHCILIVIKEPRYVMRFSIIDDAVVVAEIE